MSYSHHIAAALCLCRCQPHLGVCGFGGPRMSASRGLIKAAGPAVCSPVRLFLIEEFLLGRQNLVSDWVGRFDSPAR